MNEVSEKIHVSSEVGTLKRLMIHKPDGGIGKIVPRIKDQLLYDDIVFLKKMKEEYNEYQQVLLWFLDPEVIKNRPKKEDDEQAYYEFFEPGSPHYFKSEKVMDVEALLIKVLEVDELKNLLVASICALENCDLKTQSKLIALPPEELSKVLITGTLNDNGREIFLFVPVPNLIFTRDVGIVINDHLLLNKPSEWARDREAILVKYIAYYQLFRQTSRKFTDLTNRIIELDDSYSVYDTIETDTEKRHISLEGGDVMMISPRHLLVGASERTTPAAIEQLTNLLFDRHIVDKVTVISIPKKRAYMHIDTVFTQVKKDLWILFSPFSKKEILREALKEDISGKISRQNREDENAVKITQFLRKGNGDNYEIDTRELEFLDDLFTQISTEDFDCERCEIIQSAGGIYPYTEREQWTDACNFLAIREGVIIGYDRNVRTAEEFRKKDFKVIDSADFIAQMESGKELDEVVTGDTLILLPSSELSRARGGTHCMSMPLWRELK